MVRVRVKLDEVLKKRGMSQKELSQITKIRPSTISEICNNQRSSINKEHLETIIEALGIKYIDEIITIEEE